MIRITLEKGKELEFDSMVADYGEYNGIHLYSLKLGFKGFPFDSIYKIEKQVKDLTIDECFKADVTSIDFDRSNEHKVIINYYDGEISKLCNLDDYMDITNMFKEEKDE